ncbi:MAG: UDP-3-O-(3-hydroxymyristoyl)glucosamine N-acyltransferase [Rickettsiales bacterium]|nr:UDP-3-O-(3-hydroxymyristoyl)glucosamine N-acyltransferase [Rickettsiales bacterium]
MIDINFYNKNHTSISVETLLEVLSEELVRSIIDNDINDFINITTLDKANSNDISFIHNIKYLTVLRASKAGLVLISEEIYNQLGDNKTHNFVLCKNVYDSCSKVLEYFYSYKKNNFFDQTSHTSISEFAKISSSAVIGNNCIIGKADIGDNVFIHPNTIIGDGVKIGDNSEIGSNVTINYSVIGKNCFISPGCRLGSEGFGFTVNSGMPRRLKHFGRVILEDNVTIGDNAVIHKGSLKDTIIGTGTKIDALVHIAHNVEIGKYCFIAAQTGFAGSTKVGDMVSFGGQVGVAGHITIGSNVRFAAQAGVTKNISDNSGDYYGMPATSKRVWQKTQIMLRKLSKNK